MKYYESLIESVVDAQCIELRSFLVYINRLEIKSLSLEALNKSQVSQCLSLSLHIHTHTQRLE